MSFTSNLGRLLPTSTRYVLRRWVRGGPAGPGTIRPRKIFKGHMALAAFDAIVAKNFKIKAYRDLRNELTPTYESSELLFDYVCAAGAQNIIELGTASCQSTQGLVRAACFTGGKVSSFDPCMYTGYIPPKYHLYWEFSKLTGEEGCARWNSSKQVDLLYVDTDPHTYEQTKMWLDEYWVKSLKPDGLILFDDGAEWQQHAPGYRSRFGVLGAIQEFVERNQERVEFFLIEDNAPPFHGVAVVKLTQPKA